MGARITETNPLLLPMAPTTPSAAHISYGHIQNTACITLVSEVENYDGAAVVVVVAVWV